MVAEFQEFFPQFQVPAVKFDEGAGKRAQLAGEYLGKVDVEAGCKRNGYAKDHGPAGKQVRRISPRHPHDAPRKDPHH